MEFGSSVFETLGPEYLSPKTPRIKTLKSLVNILDSEISRAQDHPECLQSSEFIQKLKSILLTYDGNDDDWKRYSKVQPNVAYSRNLITQGSNNGFKLLLNVWNPPRENSSGDEQPSLSNGEEVDDVDEARVIRWSQIQDNSGSNCIVRMLEGELYVERYKLLKTESQSSKNQSLKLIGGNVLNNGGVIFLNDEMGVHRFANKTRTQPTCSLHLYVPGFDSYNVYDKLTGESTRVTQEFYHNMVEDGDSGEHEVDVKDLDPEIPVDEWVQVKPKLVMKDDVSKD
ncbi:Cysteine dioxygenase [Mycoemilia scoparia]|uniref:Cysteine dioxygenase n=1 Tax=Mycoemilia scoparia TaxID=417184 RepID=A0A9W8DJB9_9FUNG|nr:Cysteine dioxygenase [Mycoemilia scoparia]